MIEKRRTYCFLVSDTATPIRVVAEKMEEVARLDNTLASFKLYHGAEVVGYIGAATAWWIEEEEVPAR